LPNVLAPVFQASGFPSPRVEHHAFSDTIAVAASLPGAEVQNRHGLIDSLLVDVVCQCAAYVLRNAPKARPPLVYRGVVTCGELLVDKPHLLGPAVDEAANLVDEAEGAFVWLAPSAELKTHARRPYTPQVWETMAVRYKVPLKNGRTI